MIKTIIFDIGGVVTFTDFKKLNANFANRVGISPDFITQYNKEHWTDLLLANITLENYFQEIQKAGAKSDLKLKEIWMEEALKVRVLNMELLNIITKLKENFIVGVLSNLTQSRFIIDEALHLYDYFDFVVLSCVEKIKKPDPRFYQLALQKANCSPAEAVFVDDNEKNVIAARELGLNDILYIDNKKLITDLKSLKITLPLFPPKAGRRANRRIV